MKYKNILLMWLTAMLLGSAFMTEAKVYKCLDENGVVSFQEKVCEPRPGLVSPGAGRTGQSGVIQEKHFLWHASSPQGTLYLLGSLHFGTPAMYPLPDAIMESYGKAAALVVEVNMLEVDAQTAARQMSSMGTLPPGKSLRDMLDAAAYMKLQRASRILGIPLKTFERQKPWFAAMTLSVMTLQSGGFDAGLGIDNYFLRQASGARPVLELESLSQQLAMLDGLAPPVQQAMLIQTLNEYEQGPAYFNALLQNWRRGDAAGLQALVEESIRASAQGAALYDAFLTQRNRRMVERLLDMLKEEKVLFVVVGAAHLVGGQGIIELLRQKGFSVVQQ